MATTPNIVDVYPANGAKGIPIGDQVTVTFDQEMDEDTINTGTFVLTGPDEAPVFGPVDVTPFDVPGFEDEDILSSPYFAGYVKGTISFSWVDASGGVVDDDLEDTTGAGDLWQTVAIFTPDKPLKPNVEYKVILLGDEAPADDFDTGIKTRTVFDTEFTGSGTGRLTFHGGYTGDEDRTYVVEITSGGSTGDAEYIWWKTSDPLTTYAGITSTGARELEDGVYILCDADGTFTTGDQFQAVVVPALTLENNYNWSFFTGSGSILTPPSTSPTSGIESVAGNIVGSGTYSSFSVTEISPEDGEYGIPISEDPYAGETITVTFSDDPNPATLAGDAISVKSIPANGDWDTFDATGDLEFVASLVDNVLTIDLDPGQLLENNIVILELDKSIADADGVTLGTDLEFYFGTTYTPLYSSERRIRLDIGPLITDVPEETIMLAILEASLQAEANTLSTVIHNYTYFKQARWQYTTCLAEMTLVKALLGDTSLSDGMSKRLGELSVTRTGGTDYLLNLLAKLEDCAFGWETSIQTGGDVTRGTSLRPRVSVKGALAEDAIVVHRQWEPTSSLGPTDRMAAANANVYSSGRRDLKTFRRRNGNTNGW
jgi:hypothetical protein